MTEPISEATYQVTLDNCAREPIHIPGRIQSHGVLIGFALDRTVSHRSVNAQALLGGLSPQLGQPIAQTCFATQPEVLATIEECFEADGVDVQPIAMEVVFNNVPFDLVGHRVADRVIVELEPRAQQPVSADHAFKGHGALGRLRRQRSVDELLKAAVEEVRALTGFDRVMAYRFRHDDSGDVVAEAVTEALDPFVGRRYPASDIPAQARRLYVLSTLRNIADVNSETVAVEAVNAGGAGPDSPEPLDMSHCVLRGVSPVHIEYLRNMGVGSSMSISIVINGKLWGMLACHHMQPRFVPYAVRSACDVLAQVLAANVQGQSARADAERIEGAVTVRGRALETFLHTDEGIFSLMPHAAELSGTLDSHALVLAESGRISVWGELPLATARALVQWLESSGLATQGLLARQSLEDAPDSLREQLGIWSGFLALQFSAVHAGWIIFLRKEQVETIAWGGKPEKEYTHGPLGPRLTPRGSFDVWKETVRGSSVPWSDVDLAIGQGLLTELLRANASRTVDVERARAHLLSVLNEGMQREPGPGQNASERSPSATRMQQLVGNVLDASRIQSGQSLVGQRQTLDLSELLKEVIDRIATTYPNTRFIRQSPLSVMVEADAERLRQLISGLVNNARQHGDPGEPVLVQLHRYDNQVVLDVSNAGQAIADAMVPMLFDPFRQREGGAPAASGLGLGLYIAQHIAKGHGGDVSYSYAEPYVVFSVTLPALPV